MSVKGFKKLFSAILDLMEEKIGFLLHQVLEKVLLLVLPFRSFKALALYQDFPYDES